MINAADSVSPRVPLVLMNTVLTNVISSAPLNFDNKKVGYKNGLLYSAHGFISDRITIYNRSYLLSSCKTLGQKSYVLLFR